MRVTVTLEHNFGHPDNRPTKQGVLKAVTEKLSKAIEGINDNSCIGLQHWEITSIEVE